MIFALLVTNFHPILNENFQLMSKVYGLVNACSFDFQGLMFLLSLYQDFFNEYPFLIKPFIKIKFMISLNLKEFDD